MLKSSLLVVLMLFSAAYTMAETLVDKRPNILLIMVDDLRVELGAYGASHAQTPNIDKLASQGTRFANAYVSVPVCGASRASLFTGLRATRERFKNYHTWVEKDAPGAVTLFEYFKNHGYQTLGFGKVFHHAKDTAKTSWTAGRVWTAGPDQQPKTKAKRLWRNYQRPENKAVLQQTGSGPATELFDGPDNAYYDGRVAEQALTSLAGLAETAQPFFMAVGFAKPHLPFNAPRQYWELYNAAQFELPDNKMPLDAPARAQHYFGELRAYSDIPPAPAPIDKQQARQLIHGYHAAVSYIDAQVGQILQRLDSLSMADNTIVIAMGDHGFSLGEHGLWCKHSTFDVATKAPLIIRAPGMPKNQTVNGLVEFIDLFPTLVELAALPQPSSLPGVSMAGLLVNAAAPGKAAVFPRYLAAEAIRTRQYTLTQWFDVQGRVTDAMLYDNHNDPGETRNLANQAQYQNVLQNLSEQLAAHIANRQ